MAQESWKDRAQLVRVAAERGKKHHKGAMLPRHPDSRRSYELRVFWQSQQKYLLRFLLRQGRIYLSANARSNNVDVCLLHCNVNISNFAQTQSHCFVLQI